MKPFKQATLRLVPLVALALAVACGDGSGSAEAASDSQATPTPEAAQQQAPSGPYASPEAAERTRQEQQVLDLARLGHNEGDEESALIRVVEFSDFGCVHCAGFHTDSYPELHGEFIEAGDVVWKYIPITIAGFPNSDVAAVAGECAAEQDRFAAMRDRLFERREEWLASDVDAVMGLMEEYAEGVGLDRDQFSTCLAESERARQRVSDGNALARDLGVRGTPTFIVGGQPVQGAPPLEAFQNVLRQMLADAREPGS